MGIKSVTLKPTWSRHFKDRRSEFYYTPMEDSAPRHRFEPEIVDIGTLRQIGVM
jgi:hypothetical protein